MNKSLSFVLIGLLLVISFLAGTRWKKTDFNEKNLPQNSPRTTDERQTQVFNEPTVLGAAAMSELVKDGVVLGSQTAKVTVVEISDPSCPYCAIAAGFNIPPDFKVRDPNWEAPGPKLVELAKEGKIQLVFRYFPGHGSGEQAMQALWCAEEQKPGVFWDYLDLVFKNQKDIANLEKILDLGESLNLTKEKIRDCVQSEKYKARLESDSRLISKIVQENKYETFGTPAFFINGSPVIGAQGYENFEKIINSELNQN